MSLIKSFKNKFSIFFELISFLWKAKLWWMIPMITVMILISLMIILGTSSPLGPFIYTLF